MSLIKGAYSGYFRFDFHKLSFFLKIVNNYFACYNNLIQILGGEIKQLTQFHFVNYYFYILYESKLSMLF